MRGSEFLDHGILYSRLWRMLFFKKKKCVYFFLWWRRVLAVAHGVFVASCGIFVAVLGLSFQCPGSVLVTCGLVAL